MCQFRMCRKISFLAIFYKCYESITNHTTIFAKLGLKRSNTINQGQSSLRSYSCFFSFRAKMFVSSSLIPCLQVTKNTGPTQIRKSTACPDLTLKGQLLNCRFYVTTHRVQDDAVNILNKCLVSALKSDSKTQECRRAHTKCRNWK